jgi:transposase
MQDLPVPPRLRTATDFYRQAAQSLVDFTSLRLQEERESDEVFGRELRRQKNYLSSRLSDRTFLDTLQRGGVRASTAAGQAELLREFRQRRGRMRELLKKVYRLEIELHHKVFDLYGLTPDEVQLLRETAPPRDPLRLAEVELASLEQGGDE